MAGPYEMLAYYADKEREETSRRQFASEFAKYQSMNPEATKDDMMSFLSAAGQTPYGIAPARYKLDAMAQRNNETKQKRLLEEARDKHIQGVKETEAVQSVFNQQLEVYGGDEAKAREATSKFFGVQAGDPNSAFIADKIKNLDTAGLSSKFRNDKANSFLNDGLAMVKNGATWEQVQKAAPVGSNLEYLKSVHGERAAEDARRAAADADQKKAREMAIAEQQAAAKAQMMERARQASTLLATGKMTGKEIAALYPEDFANPEFVQATQTFQRTMYRALKEDLDNKMPAAIEEAGKSQITAMNLGVVASDKKGSLYEGMPYIAVAADQIARTYYLTPAQQARLTSALADGKLRKAKTTSEAMEMMRKAAFSNGAEKVQSLQAAVSSKSYDAIDERRVGDFNENLAHQLSEYQNELTDIDTRLKDAAQDPSALQAIISDLALLRKGATSDLIEGTAVTLFGAAQTFDRKKAMDEGLRMDGVIKAKEDQAKAALKALGYRAAPQTQDRARGSNAQDAILSGMVGTGLGATY